ncbi:MAG: glutathione S-transferase family protein [Alphaproteobacteria bacterium]|nr:glutathione S-transferase family protein [Alphaproteobacteria bacterium]
MTVDTQYTLFIGTRNYSSWSLRPWLAMKMADIHFTEIVIPLRQPDTREKILEHSPSGKVPLLVIERQNTKELVWDSFAICETLAERLPAAQLWPEGAVARAFARSIAAEMHSGFAELRAALPMEIIARKRPAPLADAVHRQVNRIHDIWYQALKLHGGRDGFLFGRFSIADAFYAPVVTRFVTHGISLPPLLQEYSQRILALPAMQQWAAATQSESR